MESLFDLNWSAPTEFSPLSAGEAHIWCTSLDQPLSTYFELKSFLSVDEQVKAARFRNEQSRRQYVLGRGLLRKLLSGYLREHPTEITFVYGDHGKPVLFHPVKREDVRFNISHSGELVLLGFAHGSDIGVDVEQMRPVPEADVIAERFFSPSEAAAVAAADSNKRDVFFETWTRKEAALKCSGVGIADASSGRNPQATIYELKPAPGYAGAVALAHNDVRVQTLRWSPEISFLPTAFEMREL